MLVQKYGGGILANKADFQRIVKIVERTKPVAVVVSAVQNATDELIAMLETAKSGKCPTEQLSALKERHLQIANGNEKQVSETFTVIEKTLRGISLTQECSDKLYAQVISRGEYLSALILQSFLPTYSFWPAEQGIEAHGSYLNARCNYSKTKKPPKNAIVTGFYGIDEKNEVHLFGRGGTDYTAAVISRVLNASSLEFWKNVDGFLTADPRIVRNASFISQLSFEEASELSRFGAKILHPSSMEPLFGTKTQIEIKNIEAPEKRGTVVTEKRTSGEIAAITGRKNVAALSISGEEMVGAFGIASKILSRVANAGVSVDVIATAQANISFTVSNEDAEKALAALSDLTETFNISKKEKLALLGVVGTGLKQNPALLSRIFAAMANHDISIEMISQGASEIDLSILVEEKHYEKAVQVIHAEFFTK